MPIDGIFGNGTKAGSFRSVCIVLQGENAKNAGRDMAAGAHNLQPAG